MNSGLALATGAAPLLWGCPPPCALAAPVAVGALRLATNYGGKERGGSGQRLTQEERRKRLAGKSPDEKRAAAAALEEAEQFISQEFPDDLAALLDKKTEQAQAILTRLSNPVLALERVEVDINGVKRPLMQLATVVKVNTKELSVTPHDPAHLSVLINRLTRHDASLAPVKNVDKIKATIEPVTKQRREAAAGAIEGIKADFDKRLKNARRIAINKIQELHLAEPRPGPRHGAADRCPLRGARDIGCGCAAGAD